MHHLIGKRSFTRLLSRDHTRFYLPPACLSASPNETAAPAFSSSFTPIRQKGEQHLQHAFSHKAMRCGVSIGVTPNARVGLVMRCQWWKWHRGQVVLLLLLLPLPHPSVSIHTRFRDTPVGENSQVSGAGANPCSCLSNPQAKLFKMDSRVLGERKTC